MLGRCEGDVVRAAQISDGYVRAHALIFSVREGNCTLTVDRSMKQAMCGESGV